MYRRSLQLPRSEQYWLFSIRLTRMKKSNSRYAKSASSHCTMSLTLRNKDIHYHSGAKRTITHTLTKISRNVIDVIISLICPSFVGAYHYHQQLWRYSKRSLQFYSIRRLG